MGTHFIGQVLLAFSLAGIVFVLLPRPRAEKIAERDLDWKKRGREQAKFRQLAPFIAVWTIQLAAGAIIWVIYLT